MWEIISTKVGVKSLNYVLEKAWLDFNSKGETVGMVGSVRNEATFQNSKFQNFSL